MSLYYATGAPWTAVEDYPDHLTHDKPVPPCGFKVEFYPATGAATHYRFVPECDFEIEED